MPTPRCSRPAFLAGVPACDPSAVRVAVLMGGTSAEREVSLMSGGQVAASLETAGFRVEAIDLDPSDVRSLAEQEFDAAFIALHGTFGEDGQLQRQLDDLGILYVGSGAEASRRAMDKVVSKEAFVEAGLPTPPWRVEAAGDEQAAREAFEALGPAVVVKPIDEGSSIAVTLADDWNGCAEGLDEVFRIRRQALVERWVVGRELTVSVLHTAGLPVIEIIPAVESYDYEAKYIRDDTQYILDPALPPGVDEALRRAAVAAHQTLGCRDFSRVDAMLDEAGKFHLLEVNTIPGFTTHSLMPKAAAAAGIDMPSLCRIIIELALWRGGRGGER